MSTAPACDKESDVASPRVAMLMKASQMERTAPDKPRFSPPTARIVAPDKSASYMVRLAPARQP